MRYASIDIGTNTILMLIGEIDDSLKIKAVKDFYQVPRLGKNVSLTRKLAERSVERALEVLENYKGIADGYEVDRVVASATSAVRDAGNGDDFIERVKNDVGIEVEIISGETEADIGFMGAVSGSPYSDQPTLVIDIGGGSTELSYGTGMKPVVVKSIDIGAVRVTEKFFHHDPANTAELDKADKFIKAELDQFPFATIDPRVIIGVAGTPTTLALIAQRKYEFDVSAVTNYLFTMEKLGEVYDEIKVKTTNEILKLTKAAEGRADVLVAGALILIKILEAVDAKEFLTSDRGLRYGYLLYKHKQLLGK
jgi:exopolyphosphatase/guanosine-5'-triphosphate,3'-diphosphate pyrophosphatase